MFAIDKLLVAMAATLASQPVAADEDSASNCSISGIEFVKTSVSPKAQCEGFQRRIDQTLADDKRHNKHDLTLIIQKRGSIQATLTTQPPEGAEKTVVLGLDVMDRPILQKDLNELVDAVARAIAR